MAIPFIGRKVYNKLAKHWQHPSRQLENCTNRNYQLRNPDGMPIFAMGYRFQARSPQISISILSIISHFLFVSVINYTLKTFITSSPR